MTLTMTMILTLAYVPKVTTNELMESAKIHFLHTITIKIYTHHYQLLLSYLTLRKGHHKVQGHTPVRQFNALSKLTNVCRYGSKPSSERTIVTNTEFCEEQNLLQLQTWFTLISLKTCESWSPWKTWFPLSACSITSWLSFQT